MNEWMVKIKDVNVIFNHFKVFITMFVYGSSIDSALEFSEIKHEDPHFIMFSCKHVPAFQTEFDFRMRKVKILEHFQ